MMVSLIVPTLMDSLSVTIFSRIYANIYLSIFPLGLFVGFSQYYSLASASLFLYFRSLFSFSLS